MLSLKTAFDYIPSVLLRRFSVVSGKNTPWPVCEPLSYAFSGL